MSEPAPWDLPPKPPRPPRSERRGPSKVKPLSHAARVAMAQKNHRDARLTIVDCQGCGFWVLAGKPEGWSEVVLDIWVIPWEDAVILSRYHLDLGLLWRECSPGQFDTWAPWNKCGALLPHRCGNKWWLFRPSIYVERVRNERMGN